MAVLYDLLTHGPAGVQAAALHEIGGGVMLFGKQGQETSSSAARESSTRGEGIDAVLDVRVDDGVDRSARDEPRHERTPRRRRGGPCARARRSSTRTSTCALPGREDEETIASGTAAAAAGGYCAILAMPNTDPVVDSAAVLGVAGRGGAGRGRGSRRLPRRDHACQSGAELTEMAELADAGAAGFSDDGQPVVAPGLMRRALQYSAVTGRRLALHCEEPTLSKSGQMHEGAVSAELGFAGYPSVAESLMVERDLALAAYERQPVHLLHLSASESVEALSRAQVAGVVATGGGDAASSRA